MPRIPLLLLVLSLTLPARALEIFVAPDGDDTAIGSLEKPLATLSAARDRVRTARKTQGFAEPVTIQVRAGLFSFKETLKLEEQDSGTAEAPLTIRGYGKERPVLSGGLAVTDFKPFRGEILQADLRPSGLAAASVRQLLFAGQRQILARYPNYAAQNPYAGGWAYADGEMWPMYADKEGENRHTLQVKAPDWRTWERPHEVEVFVFPRYNWWNDILRVKAVDSATHLVTTATDASYAMRPNDRYYFQNALEELDAPGEWYLHPETATLYFWPPEPLRGRPALLPRLQSIVELTKARHVRLQGLDFECCNGVALVLRDCTQASMAACALRAVGGFSGGGISIQGGQGNGAIGCDISFTGRNGISLGGGDRKTLTGTANFAENCYIHHPGVFYKQGVGVSLDGVGQRVSHCYIHDTPRFAIMFGGNSHILEYNHLRHLALETEDVGATYCGGRDWISPRGTVIRYNFIHDVLGFGWNGKWTSPYFAWGIYLDDNSGGVDVFGNIVARCGRSLIHGHSARDCRVENNIFVEGGQRQWEFNGWLTTHRFWTEHLPKMVAGYDSVAQEPAWQKLRGMHVRPEAVPDKEGRVMSGNEFHRNLIVWKNTEARALNAVNFDRTRNDFDRNLYWHYGQPILTGQRKAGAPLGGNLLKNGSMDGEAEKMPAGWNWQIFPRPDARARVVMEATNAILKIDAALNLEKKRDNYPIVATSDVELEPGQSFRLRARMKSDRPNARAGLLLQYYLPKRGEQPGHFWASSPADARPVADWKEFEFNFTIPAKGERGYHPEMKKFRVRVDWNEPEGSLWVDDVELQQVQALDEWTSWQQLGGDEHSLVADPKFVAPEKDDYRLQPDSPAFALGFQQIPTEKIGLYADPLRASWPIVEAEGAREHPVESAK